jgi:hypothetical protein
VLNLLKKVKYSTLQEIQEDGIFAVSSSAVKHSTVGEFTAISNPKKPAGGSNGGNMNSRGHFAIKSECAFRERDSL